MSTSKFKNNRIFMPVTLKQFEDLTNEMLTAINELTKPNNLDADYMGQIVMSALHGQKSNQGYVFKHTLFEDCVNRVSRHVTWFAVEEIKKRLAAKGGNIDAPSADDSEETDLLPAGNDTFGKQTSEPTTETSPH